MELLSPVRIRIVTPNNMNSIDIFIQNYFSLVRTDSLTGLMLFVTHLFDASIYFAIIVFCVCLTIYLFRNLNYIILFISALLFGAVTGYLLKSVFNVNRPLGGVIVEAGKSFPSNHAIIATIFFIMLMYIFDDYFESTSRIIFITLCVLGILVVAFSRIYLGIHWTSDILGGLAIGTVVSYISVVIFRYRNSMRHSGSML